MTKDEAIGYIGKRVMHHVRNGPVGHEFRTVKLMAVCDRYAMVRRSGAIPYVCGVSELRALTCIGPLTSKQ